MTWEKSMKNLTGGLAVEGAVRLPSWSQQDHSKQLLETVGDMAQCRKFLQSKPFIFCMILQLFCNRHLILYCLFLFEQMVLGGTVHNYSALV